MVKNDTPKYHLKKSSVDQKSLVFHSMITEERTQKLELLIHLISNSRHALVVCGPQGIGKSTLLKILQEREEESWLYCLVQGNKAFTIEKLQDQIVLISKLGKLDSRIQALSDTFRLLESQRKKIVLMIDDAGHLAPGLINAINKYASEHPVLRVIFVLTHDDLYIKNSSDSAIDDCLLIEIPPLSEPQCGEFLQFLSTKPRSSVSFNEINDDMIASVYHKTHGIPGQIVAQLPGLEAAKKPINSSWVLVSAVVGLVIVALGVQWFSASKYNVKPIFSNTQNSVGANNSLLSQLNTPSEATNTSHLGQVELGLKGLLNSNSITDDQLSLNQMLTEQQQPNDALQKPSASKSVDDNDISSSKITSALQTPPLTEEQADASVEQNEGEQWIRSQAIDNYTLQVMMLSKEQSIMDVIKKYPQLVENLKYTKSTAANGKSRFTLFYGSFTSASLATQAKKTLPPEFRNSIAVKISAIKK